MTNKEGAAMHGVVNQALHDSARFYTEQK